MGQVIQAGVGQAPARQAAFKAGLAKTTTAETVNKVCASGMLAVVVRRALDRRRRPPRRRRPAGWSRCRTRPICCRARATATATATATLVDAMIHDGLWDYYFDEAMAAQGARVAAELGVTRAVQDEFAYQSHKRAHDAHEAGTVRERDRADQRRDQSQGQDRRRRAAAAGARAHSRARRRGRRERLGVGSRAAAEHGRRSRSSTRRTSPATCRTRCVDRDEPVRNDASLEAMAKLKPIDAGGTITAGNAPGVNDGAAALVLVERGLRALGRRGTARARSSITPASRGIRRISRSCRRWPRRSCSTSTGSTRATSTSGRSTRRSRPSR